MKWLNYNKGLLAVLALLILFYGQLPIAAALEFGGDEGAELLKGLMCSKGFRLYEDIWNDQPPLLTVLLATAFSVFGPSLLVSRLLAACFGLVLFGGLYWLVSRRAGTLAAFLAVFLLLASPGVALLSASVMLEVPAIATALLSVCLLFKWREKSQWGWLLASGVLMGVALQIKLTAIVVVPAILTEIALRRPGQSRSWWKETLSNCCQWISVATTIVALIGALSAKGSAQFFWKSHFADHVALGFGRPQDFPFQIGLLWDHVECVAAALVGLLLLARQQRWRELAFPAVMLSTALAVHAIHRPWWGYYYLHLAVPLTWLASVCVSKTILTASQLLSTSRLRLSSAQAWKAVALCIMAALVLVRSERSLEGAIQDMRRRPLAASDPLVVKMKEYANRTNWIYSQREVYAFHARLPVPPELTVVALKRFWSQQLSISEMVGVCRRYNTEQVVLKQAMIGGEWVNFLEDYDVAYRDKDTVLYVAKRLRSSTSDDKRAQPSP